MSTNSSSCGLLNEMPTEWVSAWVVVYSLRLLQHSVLNLNCVLWCRMHKSIKHMQLDGVSSVQWCDFQFCIFIILKRNASTQTANTQKNHDINPLNAELNPTCYLLALLGAHHFRHVSRIRVKTLTLRLLMSCIYIYDISSEGLIREPTVMGASGLRVNLLQTKRKRLYLKSQSVPRSKYFSSRP